MNQIKALKWTKLLGYISGGGLASVFVFFSLLVEKPINWPNAIIGAGVAITSIAGGLGVLLPPPAAAVIEAAPTISASTGQVVGINKSEPLA